MSHVKVVTLSKIGDVPIVCKTRRDISIETALDLQDNGWQESLLLLARGE